MTDLVIRTHMKSRQTEESRASAYVRKKGGAFSRTTRIWLRTRLLRFATRAGRGCTLWYVGKAPKSFKQEYFASHELN